MGKLAGFRKVLLGSAGIILALSTTHVSAQVATYYDNNVTVDLSVLDDNSSGPTKRSMANPSYSGAKLPPVGMPKSTFHGLPGSAKPAFSMQAPKRNVINAKPASRIVLRKPTVQPKAPALPTSRLAKAAPTPVAPKTVALKKTIAAPKAKVASVAPKPVAPKVEIAKAQAPAPKPAPTKSVSVEKVEAPKAPTPKPLAKIEPKTAAKPAPAKVMAEAPPPPPPSAVEPKEIESAMKTEAKKSTNKTVAALPSATESSVRVSFQTGQSKLPSTAETNLKKLADNLRAHADNRVQLLAYAGGESLTASKARRLSLSRALAVRSYLIGQGVRSTRIDVRALGNKTTEEPFDRVDVQVSPR